MLYFDGKSKVEKLAKKRVELEKELIKKTINGKNVFSDADLILRFCKNCSDTISYAFSEINEINAPFIIFALETFAEHVTDSFGEECADCVKGLHILIGSKRRVVKVKKQTFDLND